eukprot:4015661-Amphidinium_carterae.2
MTCSAEVARRSDECVPLSRVCAIALWARRKGQRWMPSLQRCLTVVPNGVLQVAAVMHSPRSCPGKAVAGTSNKTVPSEEPWPKCSCNRKLDAWNITLQVITVHV